jgi:uncharacterized protein YjiS (DUF1127 family)
MTQIIDNIVSWLERQERVRRTIRELNLLTDRELSDVGISRCDITRVAYKSGERMQ